MITKKTEKRTKRTSVLKAITSIALAILLCVTMTLPVIAAPTVTPEGAYEWGEGDQAEAAITKILTMPSGTTIPTADFKFTFTKISFSGEINPTELAKMPPIGTVIGGAGSITSEVTISISDGDTDEKVIFVTEENGIKTVIKESEYLLAGITWPSAGVYMYKVTENPNTYTAQNGANGLMDKMTYSPAEYNFGVWVENGTDGVLYVRYIGAQVITVDNPGQSTNDKVDPTPDDKTTSIIGDYSEMIFTNTYLKNNGGTDPTDPDHSVLAISKTVSSTGNANDYFNFSVTITNPKTIKAADTMNYAAYILTGTGSNITVVTPTTDNAVTGATVTGNKIGFSITGAASITFTLKLKHGQRLAFLDLPVGASFTATETPTADYTPSYALLAYNETAEDVLPENIIGTQGAQLTAPSSAYGIAYVAEDNKSAADFLNTFKSILPTGIAVEDMPYIIIIAVVLTALAGYIALKIRKSAKGKA